MSVLVRERPFASGHAQYIEVITDSYKILLILVTKTLLGSSIKFICKNHGLTIFRNEHMEK